MAKNIYEIGFADSYGGMISAGEARNLTEKGKENIRFREIEWIVDCIKDSAGQGKTNATLELIGKQISELKALGYKVTPDEVVSKYSKVCWALEDNGNSNPSKTPDETL